MISYSIAERVLDAALSTGADFAEIFLENSYSSELSMSDSKPSTAVVGRLSGAGIRVFFGHEQIYTTTNDLSEAGLIRAARMAASSRPGGQPKQKTRPFNKHDFDEIHTYGTKPWEYDRDKKFSYLQRMDRAARQRNSKVVQVTPLLHEKSQSVWIGNSEGLWTEDTRHYVRAFVDVLMQDQGVTQDASEREGILGTSEYFESLNFEKMAETAVDRAARLIHADYAPAGDMPVIIDNGFGGVIFHEACGHGLETTVVAKESSVFCGKLGQKIAESCVTAVDDGTIVNRWGSLNIDDEGLPTRKTVLIENGVLKSYIVDRMGSLQTGYACTGSGRRQNYKFAPASRMRNTFLAPGTDSLDDMIRDVDFGLYAKRMGGGSVSPGTGDYNFGVVEGYIIRHGKIEKPVKGAVLIGRGIDTLGRISRVGKDLHMESGMCGSVSGSVPTTVGQPAITVSKILVGGRAV